MKNTLMPDYRYRRITDITIDDLKKLGVKGLMLDVDNTTAYDCEERFIEGVPEWIEEMKKNGMPMVVVSNAMHSRAKRMGELMNLPFIGLASKPCPHGYWRAARKMGVKTRDCAVIGDQLLTDIRGGNFVGAVTIAVDPARKEERNVKIFEKRRKKEKPIMEEFDRIHNGKRGI